MDIHFDGPFLEAPWNAGCDVSTLHPFCWGNDLRGITRWRWPIRCYEKVRRTSLEYSLDLPPHTVTVTIRMITFFDILKLGNPKQKPLFTTGILGGGVDLESIPNLPFTATHVETLLPPSRFPQRGPELHHAAAMFGAGEIWKKPRIFNAQETWWLIIVNHEKPLLLVGVVFFCGG